MPTLLRPASVAFGALYGNFASSWILTRLKSPPVVTANWLFQRRFDTSWKRSLWFQMTSWPLPGIGNGVPVIASFSVSPFPVRFPVVAFLNAASYTYCGLAKVRRVSYTFILYVPYLANSASCPAVSLSLYCATFA